MGQLAVVQFFFWLAFYAMWIYTTRLLHNMYMVLPILHRLYIIKGLTGVGVLLQCIMPFRLLLPFFCRWLPAGGPGKRPMPVALALGGISFISLYFYQRSMMLLIPMIGVGFAWASILSMPYAILTGSLPASKMGTYMGIFNFFIVIPQILAASITWFYHPGSVPWTGDTHDGACRLFAYIGRHLRLFRTGQGWCVPASEVIRWESGEGDRGDREWKI
jgi:maltose/moltooligosaccharide transporter